MRTLLLLLLVPSLLSQCNRAQPPTEEAPLRKALEGVEPEAQADVSPSGLPPLDKDLADPTEQALDAVLSISLKDPPEPTPGPEGPNVQPPRKEEVAKADPPSNIAIAAAEAVPQNVVKVVPLPAAADPAGPQKVFDRFQAMVKGADFPAATSLLEEWLKIAPKDQINRQNLARVYIQMGQFEAAIPHLAQLTANHPDDAQVWAHFARALAKLGRFGQANEAFQKSWELRSDDIDLALDYARTLSKTGRYTDGAAILEAALRLDVRKDEILAELGATLAVAGQYPKALEIYQRLHQLKPSFESALTLAQLAYKFERCDDVVAALTPFEAKFASEAPFLLLAGCLSKGKEFAAAEGWLAKAVAKEPDCYDCELGLGDALARRSLFAQAEPHYRKSMTLKPADFRAYQQLGKVLAVQAKHKESAEALSQASDRKPNDPAIIEALGTEYAASGQASAAWKVWGQLNELDPEAGARLKALLPR